MESSSASAPLYQINCSSLLDVIHLERLAIAFDIETTKARDNGERLWFQISTQDDGKRCYFGRDDIPDSRRNGLMDCVDDNLFQLCNDLEKSHPFHVYSNKSIVASAPGAKEQSFHYDFNDFNVAQNMAPFTVIVPLSSGYSWLVKPDVDDPTRRITRIGEDATCNRIDRLSVPIGSYIKFGNVFHAGDANTGDSATYRVHMVFATQPDHIPYDETYL